MYVKNTKRRVNLFKHILYRRYTVLFIIVLFYLHYLLPIFLI